MCLLTYFPAGVLPDADALRCGAQCNNDGHGFGIVVPGQDEILVFKSMNPAEAIDEFVRLRTQYPDGPALFHSRLTTHGNTSVDNCHPFVVNGDPRTVVAHNGILPHDAHPKKIGTTVINKVGKDNVPYQVITGVYDDRSDTRILADDLLMTRWSNLDSRHARKRLTRWLGRSNKILVLTTDPAYRRNAYLFNSELGEWVGGVWYSNSSFRGYGRGASGYGTWYGSGVFPAGTGRVASALGYGTEWDDDWDMPYDGEAQYGYVKNDRGVWVPPTRDRFRNDDPATWPVTLGGTRTAPQGSGKASGPSRFVTFVTCDLCQAQSVDAEYGLCYDCHSCADCVSHVSQCGCYGSPRPYSYTYLELLKALDRNAPSATVRMSLRDYRRVCATFQGVADERRARQEAQEGPKELTVAPASEDVISATVASLKAMADAPAFSDGVSVGVSSDGAVQVTVKN